MKNNSPTISAIIPTYNRAHLLPRAIKSVLNQTFQDFELIIVDDASTDNTGIVVREFQEKDKRIKYIKHKKNKGGSTVRNTGLREARGRYIAFLDSDDGWFPEKLEKQIGFFEDGKESLGLVGCGRYDVISEIGEKKVVLPPKNLRPLIENGTIIFQIHSASSVMVRRSAIENVGLFDENLRISEDRDLWLRFIQAEYDISFIYEPLFNYYIHESNIGAIDNYSKKIEPFKYFAEKYKNNFPLVVSRLLRNIGTFYILEGKKREGVRYFLKAIKKSPLTLQNYINFILGLVSVSLYKKIYKLRQG